jgi:predicted GIY-YIG superfamily endonuclease
VSASNSEKSKDKQYIYIVQASLEPSKCKIGKTNDLERRLKEYNSMTGKSKENIYQYLFTCEVKNMAQAEIAIKKEFSFLREEQSKEIYFYNAELLEKYVNFIKSHNSFVKEIFIKPKEKKQVVKIIKKTSPSLEERGVTRKELLQKAQKIDNDEFYTRLEDIEKELSMYNKDIWKNKTVFCNCDDAVGDTEKRTSAFSLYFIKNFRELGLKKLICTHYSGPVDLFNQGAKGYIFTKFGYREMDFKKEYPEGYDGSFDHPLSLKILKEETDIVCTNPPFSRANDYWKLLIDSKKRFLIISAMTNPVTTAFIPYFMKKQVWAGFNRVDLFLNPKKELVENRAFWYTNIKIKNRPKYKKLKIVPLKEIPEKYKCYDDSKTLVVDNCFIPSDYKKPFAISIFPIFNGILEKGYDIIDEKQYFPYIDGKKKFARVLVQKI